ncbi:MAG: cystathionine beta-lyase [Acetobacteraceae bacterium]|nr:cystathionine beta-lyase [Acetobacteraceae bacterium]
MTDKTDPSDKTLGFRTRLSHVGRAGSRALGFVNPAVHRGSTVLFPDLQTRAAHRGKRTEQVLTYGTQGTQTHWALENMIAEIEGGTRSLIVGTGLAAVTLPLMAYLQGGDHCLMLDSCYGPARNFCDHYLKQMGVETTYYDPHIDESGIADLIRPNTKVVYTESPGSHTFEVQDIPAIARAAHLRGAKVLMDNTWGIHFFQPFTHGVDVSIQALTKYVGGHSDILLGSVTVNNDADWRKIRDMASLHGHYASPDDCWLALRGARTIAVRLERQMEAGIEVALWLSKRAEVKQVLHPALNGAPGHDLWRRDFTGASSLFGVVFQPEINAEAAGKFIDALQLFGLGSSWGGFESLAVPTEVTRTASASKFGGQMVRIHVGLEDVVDLLADLQQALAAMR